MGTQTLSTGQPLARLVGYRATTRLWERFVITGFRQCTSTTLKRFVTARSRRTASRQKPKGELHRDPLRTTGVIRGSTVLTSPLLASTSGRPKLIAVGRQSAQTTRESSPPIRSLPFRLSLSGSEPHGLTTMTGSIHGETPGMSNGPL